MIALVPARFPDDLDTVRALFRAYAERVGVDLGFQGFEDELASLPGKYAPPAGRIVLARDDDRAVGCVAMRPIDATTCEMKRLYVDPATRGGRLGRRLVERMVDEARNAGYRRMCLDTLPTMTAAIGLYRSLAFTPTEAYVYNPVEGALFLARDL